MSEVRHGDLLADYLSVEETAEALGVTRRTLDNMHQRREGPPRTRVGGRVYFRRTALEKWLQGQEEVPARSRSRTTRLTQHGGSRPPASMRQDNGAAT